MVRQRHTPKIIYIAGYGRSGSTVLDVLLGAHTLATSVGELVYLGEEWQQEQRICACGGPYEKCSFWEGAISDEKDAAKLMQLSRRVEHRRALPRLLMATLPTRLRRQYRDRMRHLFTYVADRSDAEWVVDSSKTARDAAGRFWALRHVAGFDVRVIHLVRDGRDVVESVVKKGTNWAVEGYRKEKSLLAERTAVGWSLANGLAWGLGSMMSENRYLCINFEDLLDSPEAVLAEVGNFIGEDLSTIIDRVADGHSFSVGHNVGGNRIRRKQKIQLRKRDKDEHRPGAGLSTYHRGLFTLLGGWLNRAFGYT